MARDPVDETTKPASPEGADSGGAEGLERGTYEIIRGRLEQYAAQLQAKLQQLNAERREVFGSIPTELITTDRITTANNCVPRDIVPVGRQFLFGFNVNIGLKSETTVHDVFATFRTAEQGFIESDGSLLADRNFEHDFGQLFKYYKAARFSKFQVIGPHLYMVFRIGAKAADIKAFKWLRDGNELAYVDNRSEHEVHYPPQHDFEWTRTHRDLHRRGLHPHISIEDRVFVETIGGDLTVKIEDNTDDGQGIFREPVDDPDQTLDDAEIFYAIVGNLILIKVRPFREENFRYLIFNEKLHTVLRLDAIAHACIRLPGDHGMIFSNGFYLQTGEHKTFPTEVSDLLFERVVPSPNGEDWLYVFYSRNSGTYALLSYNMIQQEVATPIQCHGWSIFDNGHLIYFKSDGTPRKHHAIQVWQTPYVSSDAPVAGNTDSYLYKIGNRDIVRAMAECHEVITLIGREDPYTDLYLDLVNKTTDLLDSWFWINHKDAYAPGETIARIRETAVAAVDEFDKVRRIRENTARQSQAVSDEVQQTISAAARGVYRTIDQYVESLAALRSVRGRVVSLRDLKYADQGLSDRLEKNVRDETDRHSEKCIEFLLRDDSLDPYIQRVEDQQMAIESLQTVAEARELDRQVAAGAAQLEMLIDIVSNLKIDDATKRTRIIDDISAVYARVNRTRAELKNRSRALMSVEGAAEFGSRLKLLAQAVVNWLDVCDSPARCDEYLTKLMVQVEELEGRFAEFDEYIVQLAEKREEIHAAFDAKKLQLVEARGRRATALAAAADRILKGIASRIAGLKSLDEINSYFSADLMIEKVRDIIGQLDGMDETVKVDEIQSRLKTIREDAARQLLDRNELFVAGQNLIRLGPHQFTVNVQPLELTTVARDDRLFFHLSGTNFFEPIGEGELERFRHVWDQSLVSENESVYRGEYLVWQMLGDKKLAGSLAGKTAVELVPDVQKFMSPRYGENYVKGVHDHDAARILAAWLHLNQQLGLLRYPANARALAALCLRDRRDRRTDAELEDLIRSLGTALQLFGNAEGRQKFISRITPEIESLRQSQEFGNEADSAGAAAFLFDDVNSGERHAHREAIELADGMWKRLKREKQAEPLEELLGSIPSLAARFALAHEWVLGYADSKRKRNPRDEMINEAAALVIGGSSARCQPIDGVAEMTIEEMLGDHPLVRGGKYKLDFIEFQQRLTRYCDRVVPDFHGLTDAKKRLLEARRRELRLEEFRPRVLTSFVRNRLVNEVYLPLVGDNLAKQIGVAGEGKRTDLMGLLLLISPPGYGKTTLMEYIANRLGLTFMKINGPAISHQVTSLDPDEAPNASAREEVEKLNLALEMGDNVMIYVDDIQHCHPEFLQKFISLCDATRRIEGVFRGRARTYDLRGRKVCVVMAGNPYTESGEKFQIPDMLANRADTYNLGDVIGDQRAVFELSYLENSLTSNPTLATLHTRGRDDVPAVIRIAGNPTAVEQTISGNFSVEEINEFVAIMRKLITIRDVVLRVNKQYIESAAQAEAYRTEPAFKLQGSYRDMNKMAERVVPIMNDEELHTLIVSHYENQAQTLATGAEANLLKFRELLGILSDDERKRWDAIRKTFQRNLLLGAAAGDDQVSRILAHMTTFSQGREDIRGALDAGIARLVPEAEGDSGNVLETATLRQIGHAVDQLSRFNETLSAIRSLMEASARFSEPTPAASIPAQPPIEIINKVPQAFSNIIEAQFRMLQTWIGPLLRLGAAVPEAAALAGAANLTERQYRKLLEKLREDPPGENPPVQARSASE